MNIEEQNRAYYESLQQDMEKDFLREIEEIERQTRLQEKELELQKKIELERKIEMERKIEIEKNRPSNEELRQRRLKFYENK